jgi:transposase
MNQGPPTCTCPDFEKRGEPCKHVFAVQFVFMRECTGDGFVSGDQAVALMPQAKAKRSTYKQDWPAYNAAQTNEKAKFQTILRDLCRCVPTLPRKPGAGRKPVPLSDMVFAATFKVYSIFSGRRFQTDLDEATEKGYLSRPVRYNTIFDYLDNPILTPILIALIQRSSLPLKALETDFAVDSSGFTSCRFVKWFDHKYGVPRQEHDWVKVSVMTGVKTNIVTAVEVDERYAADCPQFSSLVQKTADGGFTLREVSADAAYLSYENMETVASVGATPYILFKTNTTAAEGGVFEKMFHLYNLNRENYLKHYHKRSNVESTFSMVKAKFGDHLRSKTDTAMVNEALCKILGHNICCLIQSHYELGVAVEFWGEEANEATAPVLPESVDPIDIWAWV